MFEKNNIYKLLFKCLRIKIRIKYEDRIKWFLANYYESGMEYGQLLRSMKNKDLDNLEWYGDTVNIPKYLHEI